MDDSAVTFVNLLAHLAETIHETTTAGLSPLDGQVELQAKIAATLRQLKCHSLPQMERVMQCAESSLHSLDPIQTDMCHIVNLYLQQLNETRESFRSSTQRSQSKSNRSVSAQQSHKSSTQQTQRTSTVSRTKRPRCMIQRGSDDELEEEEEEEEDEDGV